MKKTSFGRVLTAAGWTLTFCAGLALLVIVSRSLDTKTLQDDWKDALVQESVTFQIPGETNIREYPNTFSGEENARIIISNGREYSWSLTVKSYYETKDYQGRIWYGVAADAIDLTDCPKKLAKWCEKNSDCIFWFTPAGSAVKKIDSAY